MTIDDELLSAWAGVAPPAYSSITEHACPECDEIREFFAGTRWPDLVDVPALHDHRDALHLFTPSAYHYYLPAFMRATLLDPQAADSIPDGIVYTIELEFGSASQGRIDLFSTAQRDVLASFLRLLPTLDLEDEERVTVLAALLEA